MQAFVVEQSDVEIEAARGGGHELEQSGGTRGALGAGIEGGFDFGEPDEFARHFLFGEDFLEADELRFGGGRGWGGVDGADPDGALELGRGRGKAELVGDGGADLLAELVRDVEVNEVRFQPCGVGLGFFVAFKDRLELYGGGAQRGEVINVVALEAAVEVVEELADAKLVHAEGFKDGVVDVFSEPVAGVAQQFRRVELFLGARRQAEAGAEQGDGEGGGDGFHRTFLLSRGQVTGSTFARGLYMKFLETRQLI